MEIPRLLPIAIGYVVVVLEHVMIPNVNGGQFYHCVGRNEACDLFYAT